MLTKDDTWISRSDLVRDFSSIPDAIEESAAKPDLTTKNPQPPTSDVDDKSMYTVGMIIEDAPLWRRILFFWQYW